MLIGCDYFIYVLDDVTFQHSKFISLHYSFFCCRESVDLPLPYLSALNDLIKKNSGDAAVCLLNLPTPPKDVISLISLKHVGYRPRRSIFL